MTAAELQSWLDERRMTRRSFGLELEVSQDRLRRWLSGQVRIPRHIELACRTLDAMMRVNEDRSEYDL